MNKETLVEQFGIPDEAAEHMAEMYAEALRMTTLCTAQALPKEGQPGRLTLSEAIAGLGAGYTLAGAHLTSSGKAAELDALQEWFDGVNAVIMENLRACGCFKTDHVGAVGLIDPYPTPIPTKTCPRCGKQFAGPGDRCDQCAIGGDEDGSQQQ